MVWDYSVVKIVMLCGLEEDGRLACDVYFPDPVFSKASINVGNEFEIRYVNTDKLNPFYWVRTFQVKNLTTNESREVLHYHVRSPHVIIFLRLRLWAGLIGRSRRLRTTSILMN